MDDAGQIGREDRSNKIAQDGSMYSESQNEHKEQQTSVPTPDLGQQNPVHNNAQESHQRFDSPGLSQNQMTTGSSKNMSHSDESSKLVNSVISAPSYNRLALMPLHEVSPGSNMGRMNINSEKYESYHLQHDHEEGTVTASSSGMAAVGSNITKDTNEPMVVPVHGTLNVGAVGASQVGGTEIARSLSSMEVLYNTARNTFETQPQKVISSMDVLYTAARASQIHVASTVPISVPGIDVLYKRTTQPVPSDMLGSVSTSSVQNSTRDVVLRELPSHQSSPVSRVDVTSTATCPEYGTSAASVHNKPLSSYDNSTYEKYKHLVTHIGATSSSNTVFSLPTSGVPSSGSEPHASIASSYYPPQPVPVSCGTREPTDRDGKQTAGIVEQSMHSYYALGQAKDGSEEHQISSLHSDANSQKDYGRVIVTLPSMNMIPFVAAYDSYRSKVLPDENQLRGLGEYPSNDGSTSSQQKVSEAHYGYTVQQEKTSSSNLIHIPENHNRFAFHENGQIGLTHLFNPGKPEFVDIPRDANQTQTFYPRLTSHDSPMYVRSDIQKYHPQGYQDLMQGSHVSYYQCGNKTDLEQFPSAPNFGFHQSSYCSSRSTESQHVSNAKTAYPRLDSLEKALITNSNRDLRETNSDPHKSNTVTKDNCLNDSVSNSTTEAQGRVSISEQEILYAGSSNTVELAEPSSLAQHQKQLNTSSDHYLQTSSYVNISSASPKSDMSAIKMKINAILESRSLQFDDTVQNDMDKNVKDVIPNDNLKKDLKEQSEISQKILDDKSEKEFVGRHATDGLVSDETNDDSKKEELVVQNSETSMKTEKLNPTDNSKDKKTRTRNVKRSGKNGMQPLKRKTKKDSDSELYNKENSVSIESGDRKLKTSDSLKIDQDVQKENIAIPQYKCDLCQKEFTQLCSFQRHVRFHNGQSLFTCDLCSVGFNDLFSFVEHITEVESENLKQLKTIPELTNFNQNPPSLPNPEFNKTKRLRKRKFRRSKRLKKNSNSKVMKGSEKKEKPENVDVEDESDDMDNNDQDEELEEEEDVKMEDSEELQVKNFKCNECGMQFSYARYLSAHLLTHSDHKSFQCEICSKEFSHGHSLNRHRKKMHPKAVIHSCNICGEGFSRLADLKEHSNCHLADSSLKCKMCDQEFSCQRDLQQHVSSHTGGKAFQCDLCWKQFTQYCTLLRHKRRFDHSGGPPYKCKWCGEGFYEMGKLLSHSRKHMGSGPHKCDVCGKGFATTNNLKVHKSSVHSSEKPFCCDLCGDQFTRVSYLRQHIKTHTGDRPYVCELCGKGFGMQDTLSKHMRTHTGEKPYSCDQCGKQFSLTATLTVHKRTHTGERPYVCEVCGKGFIDNSSWNKHIKHHHKSPGGRETTLADKGVREATQNNYKTFSETGTVMAGTCLNKMGDLIKERQLSLEGQFLTSQMSQ